jgi:hypothetical protein
MSRCKICKHDFLMPTTVRMRCPGCQASVRVPGDAIGRDVECKFCSRKFGAAPEQLRLQPTRAGRTDSGLDDLFLVTHAQPSPHLLDLGMIDVPAGLTSMNEGSLQACPGEHQAFAIPPAAAMIETRYATIETPVVHDLAIPAEPPAALVAQTERIQSLEQALAGLSEECNQLHGQLRQVQALGEQTARQELNEIDRLRREEMREIEILRARLGRLEELRADAAIEPDRTLKPLAPARPAPRSGMPTMHNRGGHAARLTASKPGPIPKPPGARPVAHAAHGASPLREIMDRVSSCETITDRLITQLKTALDEREQDRAAFGQIVDRLQAELSRSRQDLDVARRYLHHHSTRD